MIEVRTSAGNVVSLGARKRDMVECVHEIFVLQRALFVSLTKQTHFNEATASSWQKDARARATAAVQ